MSFGSRGRKDEKGLPPLPTDNMGVGGSRKDPDFGFWSVRSRSSTNTQEGGNRKERPGPSRLPSAPSIFTDYTSQSQSTTSLSHPSPTRQRFASPSASNLFDGPPASPHSYRQYPGGPAFPPSPSVSSSRSIATSSGTSRATTKKFFSTKSAPSVRSNTMPELVAYNDVDQWGSGTGAGPRTPTPPKKGSNTPPEGAGVRRKNSSSKLLAKGLSRSLTRMGSVMKRNTSGAKMGMAGTTTGMSDENMNRRMRNRHSVVHEEMGDEWQRVDMQKEVKEQDGDSAITRPFNVEHNLHISPDLDNLPPAWLEALKAQGLSEADLLLIATARQRSGQRPMLRIVKGSLPPSHHDEVATPTTFSQARSRGLSTPAHLMISQSSSPPTETPLLDKRFSWEKSPTTPTGTPGMAGPSTPLSAFRQSLQKPPSPIGPRQVIHTSTPPRRMSRAWAEPQTAQSSRYQDEEDTTEETPKKTKRWSDQLRGFQSSFAGLGGDDDWGSSLTSALNGDMGLQTVHESDSGGGESTESARSTSSSHADIQLDPTSLPSSNSLELRTKAMTITTTPKTSPPIARSSISPSSPATPRDLRIRRIPVPLVSETPRRHSNRSTKSASTPQAERQWPTPPSPGPAPNVQDRSELSHSRSQSFPQSQSNDSELDHELRTPSTNEHFPLSVSNHKSSDALLPPLPRSISEESQWTLALAKNNIRPVTPPAQKHPWAQFGFTHDSNSPPRPDPRLSLPATAHYTESSPPSRSNTPVTDAEDHLPPLPSPPISPSACSKRSPRSSRSRKDKDPLSRLDTAKRSERASIALSMISTTASEARSSLNSIKSSYLREARVLRAFMKDPAELGGLRESDAERDSSTSDDRVGESGAESDQSGSGLGLRLAGPAEIHNGLSQDDKMVKGDMGGQARTSNHSSPRASSSAPKKTPSKRSQKSSIDSTRSRRSHEKNSSPISPHPFAYQPQSEHEMKEKEDDAMLALDDAAREVARQRARYTPASSPGKARFEDAEEEVVARNKFVGGGIPY